MAKVVVNYTWTSKLRLLPGLFRFICSDAYRQEEEVTDSNQPEEERLLNNVVVWNTS